MSRATCSPGLPELVVEGLRDADARALLASVIPGRLDERVADQLLAETRGNPLALLELPRGLTAAQLAGGFGLPAALSLSRQDRGELLKRLEALPEDTQRLLLVAAAEPTGDPALLWRAAERLGITGAALEPAESAGLIEIDGEGAVSPSARALGGIPGGNAAVSGGRCTGRWPRRPTRRSIPTGAPGTWPRRRPAPTRMSPPSSSGPPAGRRRGAVWPPPPPFWSGPPR